MIKYANHNIKQSLNLPRDLPDYGEDSIQVHYYRQDGLYDKWGLWCWSENAAGAEYPLNYQDDFGGIAYYPLSTFANAHSIGFIVKELFSSAGADVWVKDGDGDRFIDIDMLNKDSRDSYNIYIKSGGFTIYTNPECTEVMKAVSKVEFTSSSTIYVAANSPIKAVELKCNGGAYASTFTPSEDAKSGEVALSGTAAIDDVFIAKIIFNDDSYCEKGVSIRKLYDSAFDEAYNYDGTLGAIYSPSETTFKVWSPASTSIELRIYDNGTPTEISSTYGSDVYEAYPMSKGAKGVFSKTLSGDLEGKYYTYFVTNSSYPEGKEVVDPYAKSAGVNGLRGMIVDFSKTNPSGWDGINYFTYDRKALTVYETHIAELTCSPTWGGTEANAKLFKGFYETGTRYTENGVTVTTGFDHIKELGVNAVQIIPFFDQANDEINMKFNWGYNPLNYNVVEGGYSSNPYDGYVRIQELKELIKAYHDAGITIIMDVVYNHVNGLGGSNFDVLMPYYYFRYDDETGSASNGSGCGNETASDKYMFRKFMIDSTTFWASEYKLGGFRFDLMAIHDIETMNLLATANKAINPNIVIYGEPWAGGTTHIPEGYKAAAQGYASEFEGYGQFNDKLRDSLIAGGMSPVSNRSWIAQTGYAVAANRVVPGIQGITSNCTDDPNKTVSYVTCHDNYTLNDRILVTDLEGSSLDYSKYLNESARKRMNVLANSIVFTSQGTSFMLAGEEMLRTKVLYDEDGNIIHAKDSAGNTLNIGAVSGNSYSSSYKTNEINYSLKVKNNDLFKSYQKLIALKQSAPGLRATAPNSVEVLEDGNVFKITFAGENGKTYEAYHRNGVGAEDIYVGENVVNVIATALFGGLMGCSNKGPTNYTVDTRGASLYLDTLGRDFNENSMTLQPFETLIISR